jgi:hypothetical protein
MCWIDSRQCDTRRRVKMGEGAFRIPFFLSMFMCLCDKKGVTDKRSPGAHFIYLSGCFCSCAAAPYPRISYQSLNLHAVGSTTYVRLPAPPRQTQQSDRHLLSGTLLDFSSLHFTSSQHPTTDFTTFLSQSIRIPYSPSHHILPEHMPTRPHMSHL